MPLNPGNDTITFVHKEASGTVDQYGVPALVETSSAVTGCALQPTSEKDNITNTTYAEATNKCLTPATTFTLAIVPDDYLTDAAGLKYRIIGVRPYRDGWGRTDHITFICKWETG